MEVLTDDDREKIRQSVAEDKVHRALEAIQERHLLRLASDRMDLAGKLLACLTTVFTFTASSWSGRETMFSFIAGVIGTIGVTISGWSYSLNSECTDRRERLNVILAAAGLRTEEVPEIEPILN
eukprot:CAMPEP_0172434412 /NCGR_PEP_ID=MMETSP1064-20121228/70616_1 /TAXON_ID=202472 /ORGANISM="Aulacoseira subarctica , Strain CCAP 1002/5" /LENGTH=123 /DNA_ID=CAMNT_0013182627 /DNA_START=162 /DNA_END=533 /DNA_ORIENTATION=-